MSIARASTLAADITSATPPGRPATPSPAASLSAPQPALSAPRPAASSTLARSLVRDTVAALGALIVLVIVLLLIMSSRRRRALSGRRPQSHQGQHGHRRTSQEPRSAQPRRPVQHAGSAQETGLPARPQLTTPGPMPTPVPPVSWPAPGGWQGGSVGEIAQPPAVPARPAITPVARPAAASRSGAGMPSGPPWAPAQEPENTFGPLPVASAVSFTSVPGGGIRVPPDVAGPPATMTGPAAPRPGVFDPPVLPGSADSSAWPPLYDYTAPPPAAGPGTPATPPNLGAATIPGFPRLATGRDTADPAFTGPVPAAEESQRGMDFAAAPVVAGYPATDVPGYARPQVPATATGSNPWDLAATDVFPVTPSEPSADPDDDAPGASGS